jgi:hypothetical protein
MMALANLLHHPAIGETLMGQLFGDRQIKRSNKDLGRVVALAYLADQQDEDALDRWPSRWHEALNEMAPDQAERLAAAAPAGLYALLASAHDIEQALHTVNFGLLSATPLSSTQFVIALRRLVQALVTSRGCRARSAPVRKSQPALDGPTFVRQALARGVHWPQPSPIDGAGKNDHNTGTGKNNFASSTKKGNQKMATAKKAAPKAAANPKVKTPAKVVKPAAKPAAKKAPVSKTAKAIAKLSSGIAKLTGRKDKINAEINVLRDQRTALKAAPATAAAPAPVAPKAKVAAKAVPKAAAPAKAVRRAATK